MSSNTATSAAVEAVWEIVAEMSPFGVTDLTRDTILLEELGFDSLGLVELLVVLEERLGLPPLEDQAPIRIERVSDLECIVAKALKRALPE